MSERIQGVSHQEAIEYGGRKFRSNFEVKTAETLDALGVPYEYEPRKIILQEGFKCPYQKDKVRAITYTPDFIIGPIMLECKGFETPEWKNKKKMLFKWLMENEPDTIFYQIHDARKSLLEVLDKHLTYLGFAIQVTSKPTRKQPSVTKLYDSINEAMSDLGLKGKSIGGVLRSLTGNTQWIYNYNWKLIKIKI
jgi:hypothetical protein